jgi:hypothetical protein
MVQARQLIDEEAPQGRTKQQVHGGVAPKEYREFMRIEVSVRGGPSDGEDRTLTTARIGPCGRIDELGIGFTAGCRRKDDSARSTHRRCCEGRFNRSATYWIGGARHGALQRVLVGVEKPAARDLTQCLENQPRGTDVVYQYRDDRYGPKY